MLASGVDCEVYAEGVLEVCRYCIESPLSCAAGIGAGGRQLRERVERIASNARMRPLGFAGKAALSGLGAVLVAAPVGIGLLDSTARAQPVESAPPLANVSIEAISETINSALSGPLMVRPDGTFVASHTSLRQLISFAYDTEEPLVAGPAELDSSRYSIKATPGNRQMLQNLLTERFGLRIRRETRTVPLFELVRGPAGVSIPSGTPQPGRFLRIHAGSATLNDVPIESFRKWLTTRLGRPVVDRTGLTGRYTFTLTWGTAQEWDVSSLASPSPEVLTRALESQLGLSLADGEGAIEFLVVDDVRPPSDFPPPEGMLRLDADVLERYTGFYGIPQIGWIVRVARNGGTPKTGFARSRSFRRNR